MAPSESRSEVESEPRACASDLTLDAHLGNELPDATKARLLVHLASCKRCAERLRALETFRAEAEKLLPSTLTSPELPAVTPPSVRRPRWPGMVAGGGALAAAATIALLLAPRPDPHSGASRTKGADRLAFHVSRAGAVFEGGPGEAVRPGDTLSFSVTTQTPSFIAILSRDGQGHASIYYPSGPLAVSIPAGLNRLPEAVVLDDVVGRERLFGVFCSSPVELEPIRQALQRDGELPKLPACRVDVVPIEKHQP